MTDEIRNRIELAKNGKVPEGYQKRFSLSPIKWNEYKLSKLCKKRIQKNKGFEYDIVLSNTAVQGVIRQSDYFEKDIANVENIDTYFVVKNKDFVYNPRTSAFAPYGPIHSNQLGIDGIVSPLYTVFNLTSEKHVSYEYLNFYFDSSQWNKYMYSIANYGARYDRMNIGDKDFFDLPICIPPREEQEKIVKILTHCDKVITLKKQLIIQVYKQKKWLIQNLLNPDSGVRLEGFEAEWKESAIKEIALVISGGTPDTNISEYWNGSILWCTPTDITNSGKYISETQQKITLQGLKASSATLLPVGSILMCSRATIGTKAIAAQPITTNQGFKSFICKESLNNEFFYYYLEIILKDFLRLASGNTFKELSKTSVDNFLVRIPALDEQIAIANILSTVDRKIDLLNQELEQWQKKKKSLLQLLLTGIVRVKV